MAPNSLSQLSDLFDAAIALPADQREQYLRKHCKEPQLIEEVNLLIKYHANSSSEFILDRPPNFDGYDASLVAIGEKAGDTIGNYRLLEKIGEGGMGVVYMAEQLEGVRRKVALKIIKLGMDTRQVVARFEAERQAMALFDHPNIARVLNVGATESGRPFFVMELVRGTDISQYVISRKLPLDERLKLFTSVCNAVQHAHQKGIIHRDLKPTNILVTQFDGVPVPKVIDFGIAKAVGLRLTEKTLFTRYSAMVGTPQYMSPEQAEMTGIDVDTRSDIYSLGVLLYELITGTTPLQKADLKKLNPLALFETLRDAEIETPSSRAFRTSQDHPELAVATQLPNRGQSELDWIVMKALSRDRTQRYASANELSADVQRYLDCDPVLAAPPSKVYKLKSYANKHRTAFITATLVTLTLLIGTIVSSIFAYRANQLNNELSNALSQATANLNRAETAEAELRRTNEERLYRTANSITFAKFNSEVYSEMWDDAEQVMKESTENQDDEFFDEDFAMMGICIDYNLEDLLTFPKSELFTETLARLRNVESEEELIYQVMEAHFDQIDGSVEALPEGNEFEGSEFSAHEHTPSCLMLQKKTKAKMPKLRPRFFRLLVSEYRSTFGEDDERVCDALNLLAASLVEIRSFNEAESHLRESIALMKSKDAEVQNVLLKTIADQRK